MVFKPVIDGKSSQVVKFSNVLHVPELQNNLLSVLYHTHHSGFVVYINATHMLFSCSSGPPLFIVTLNDHNVAFLDGMTQCVTQYAQPATILPLDLALWHCQFAHHNTADIKSLVEQNLVTGMRIDSKSAADPICKPCLAGKMHANPFTTSQNCASRPLELVHSDTHQVSYQTFSGYRYWVTFIDDYSRYQFVIPVHGKSDVFDTFKQFKAFAENQTE